MKIILLLLITNFVFPLGERIQPKKYIFERSDSIKMKNSKYWKKNNGIWDNENIAKIRVGHYTKFVPSLTETAEEIKDIYILLHKPNNSISKPKVYIHSDRFNLFDIKFSIDTLINQISLFKLKRIPIEVLFNYADKDKKLLEKINIAFNEKYKSSVNLSERECTNLYIYYYIYNNKDGHKMVQFIIKNSHVSEEKLIELFNKSYFEVPFKDFINYIDDLMNNKLVLKDKDIDNLDFMDTDIEGFGSWDAPPSKKESNKKFVAYDRAPTPKKPLMPIYPKKCVTAGIEGKVVVNFYVDEVGKVDSSTFVIVESIPCLDQACIDAIKKSKWDPARQGKEKVGTWITMPFNFTLEEDRFWGF